MRIAFLGASMTEGKYGGDFVAAAQAALPEHTLLNHGIAGHTVNRLLDRVPDVLADSPDAVFVLPGGNDALAYAFPATRPYYKSQQGLLDGYLEPETYAAIFRDICTEFSVNFVHVWVGIAPLEHSPVAQAAAATFNAATREVAEALNLPVCDFSTFLPTQAAPERPPLTLQTVFQIGDRIKSGWNDYERERQAGGFTYSFDGIHLTPESAQRVGAGLAAWIREQV